MPRAKPPPSASTYRLYLLGGFRLERDGKPFSLKRIKAQPLLAYLALLPQEHRREQVAAALWAESTDADARLSLRVTLNSLRSEISPDIILADRETMQLNSAVSLWVDAREFLETGTPFADEAIQNLKSKIINYKGDLLPDHYDEWLVPLREQVREGFLASALHLVERYRGSSEYAQAIEIAQRILQVDRANETAHQHLIFCFAASGDRASALKQYEECVRALHEELAVEPSPETRALVKQVTQEPTRAKSPAAALTNLPRPMTSFVGRESEMAELQMRLQGARTSGDSNRLITLTGAGGSGKTRLAIQVARQLLEDYHDGVWFIDLALLSDESLVPQAITQALGIEQGRDETTADTLTNYLRTRNLLLILDNCEHLLNACARLVARLMSESTNLTMLATSREALNIEGESVWQVPTLATPTNDAIPASVIAFPSLRLFVERAQTAKSDFYSTAQNTPAIVEICRRLDGMPLAIELAAARVKMFTPQEIVTRLDQRFNLLTGGSRAALPRQQTLHSLLDWSFDLLAQDERVLLRRLAVFAGGWTVDAAEQICADAELAQSKIVTALAGLVDKSLVIVESYTDATRYRFLETIREYAREKLMQADELIVLQNRHLDFFIAFAERAEPELYERNQTQSADVLERDHDNLRAALTWTFESSNHLSAVRLAGALGYFWHLRGYLHEGIRWLELAIGVVDSSMEPIWRARTYSAAGTVAWAQGRYQDAKELHRQALSLYEQVEDDWHIAFTFMNIAAQYVRPEDADKRVALAKRGLEIAQAHGFVSLVAALTMSVGMVYLDRRDLYLAEPLMKQSLAAASASGQILVQIVARSNLSEIEALRGNYQAAIDYISDTVRIARENQLVLHSGRILREKGNILSLAGRYVESESTFRDALKEFVALKSIGDIAKTLACLTALLVLRSAFEAATWSAASVAAWSAKSGFSLQRGDIQRHPESIEIARRALGEARFRELWEVGSQMPPERAAERILREQVQPPA